MVNERKTENLVKNLLKEQGYEENANIIVEQQQSDNPKIDKLLKNASKKGSGKGYPEFIITFANNPENIMVIECKASTAKHESKSLKQYAEYAVDGVLLYASYLKDNFNVMAVAVSGETEQEMCISHFLWLKTERKPKYVNAKSLLNPQSLLALIEQQSTPLKEEELIKKAIEYNKALHSHSIPEGERCTLISSILIALQDAPFLQSYNRYSSNQELIEGLLTACARVLKRNNIDDSKRDIILGEYGKVRANNTLHSETITIKRFEKPNTILRDLINDINESIMPYINENVYDVLGQFYTQFIRYAGSNRKTGLVLTPSHVTDLFCDLANVNDNDIIFDPCCGTGGFLVSAMKYMLEKSGNDINKHKEIKAKQLVGIEKRPDMFSHACSNMMMRGDGKSNVFFGDCFTAEHIRKVKALRPNKAFLNPPYDVGEDGQLEFVENALGCLERGGICVAICQMSSAISSKSAAVKVKKRLMEKHTLNAVLSMPDELFHPVGVITCIMIFSAHTPHPRNKETFFGYFKDDGYIKVKHKGRIDKKQQWGAIKKEWLDAYANYKNIAGLSVSKVVAAEDEWCAEAYMETDYSTLTEEDFIKTIKNYVAFQFKYGDRQ